MLSGRSFDEGHQFIHAFADRAGLMTELGGSGCGFFGCSCVLLGDAVHLCDGLINLFDAL